MVNTESNGGSILPGNTSCLQFFKSEASAHSHLSIVLVCWTSHNWSQQASYRSGSNGQSLLLTSHSSTLLSSRLVEPSLDTVLPIFFEMSIWYHVVVLHFCCYWLLPVTLISVTICSLIFFICPH